MTRPSTSLFASAKRCRLAAFALALAGSPALQAAPQVDFNRDIRPIFSDHCYACHGPDENKRKAGLRLDQKASALAERKSGDRAIIPGQPGKSSLVTRVRSSDPDESMPPAAHRKPLRPEQVSSLIRWIEEGAEWQEHWSFIPPQLPKPPAVNQAGWIANDVDRFILAQIEKAGFQPAPEADRTVLLRRVTFDLTGLPPTPEEVDDFLADRSALAYEGVADRLMASPHFGERMAVNWLDLARYADTAGYHFDGVRFMWLWRDWVIRAFNENKPFDVFTVEQMAGDLLPNPTRDQRIATGFVRNNMTNDEGGADPDEYLNKYVVDRVNTMGAVWMGMTVGCAECHDHKFDPLRTKEFYQFYAFFHNVPEKGLDRIRTDNPPPRLPVPTAEQAQRFVEAEFRVRDDEKTLQDRRNELGETQEKWERETLAEPPAPPDERDLAALLAFDETLAVSRGPAVSADPSAPAVRLLPEAKPEYASARLGHAIKLDGKSHLDAGPLVDFHTTNAFSFAAWVKVQSGGAILSKMEKGPGFRGFDLFVSDGRFEVHLAHQYPDDALKVKTKEKFEGANWRHVLVAYDGSGKAAGVKVFVDGRVREVEVERDQLKGDLANEEPVRFGSRHGEGHFQGQIDEVRFYRRALGSEEARLLAFHGMMPVLAKSRGQRSEEERGDLQKFYKESYAVDYLRSEKALALARQERERLIEEIPTTMIMEEMDPPRETFRLVRGDFRTKAERVHPGAPEFLPPITKVCADNEQGRLRIQTASEVTSAPANSIAELGEHARPGRRWTSPRVQHREESIQSGSHARVHAREVFREGAENSARGGRAPHTDAASTLNRLDLAAWLVSPSHPLTARVTVNRYWALFFGTGLVKTINDFGSQGEWPTHPELLDWLACRFRDGDPQATPPVPPWDVKALVRLIVTSRTYRQSAVIAPDKLERDPYNRLLARSPRLPLDAEFVRDNALAVSGLLNDRVGGPSVKPYQPPGLWDGTDSKFVQDHGDDLYRRGLYVFWRRSAHYPAFATFDAPNREVCTFLRQRTQTPLQSLVLMNDPAFVECARALAERVLHEEPADLNRRLTRAFRLTLGRGPAPDEMATLQRTYEQQWAAFQAEPKSAEDLLAVGESKVAEPVDRIQLAALTAVANVLLNLNETITR